MTSARTLALATLMAWGAPAAAQTAVAPLGPPGLPTARFAAPVRPVAPVVSDRWRAEDERERVGEAQRVMDWLGVRPGMAVADIGAGSGYYTVRLSERVGPEGRVLAQDITPATLARLRSRIARERLANVAVGLGEPGDPRLPSRSADAAVMIHMYHEIAQPAALLANLVPAFKPGAQLGIVDVDDAIERHGTPRATLACELGRAGYTQVGFHWLLEAGSRSEYLAVFQPPEAPVTGRGAPCP